MHVEIAGKEQSYAGRADYHGMQVQAMAINLARNSKECESDAQYTTHVCKQFSRMLVRDDYSRINPPCGTRKAQQRRSAH